MISAAAALERLRDGNRRFTSGHSEQNSAGASARRAELVEGQAPFAVILGCSDSRVPVERVFDQGLGELLVVRVAGNVVAPTQLGSIEYAATQLGAKLIVVLGHSKCGAVDAAMKEFAEPQEDLSPNLKAIVDSIRPAIESLEEDAPDLNDAIVANIHQSVGLLHHESEIIEQLVESGELTIVGAEYSIESGSVQFLERTTLR